jgi:membrane protein
MKPAMGKSVYLPSAQPAGYSKLILRFKALAAASADTKSLDLAAQVSFYLVLSMFPFFIILAALVGALPTSDIWHSFVKWVVTYLPTDSQRAVFTAVFDVAQSYTKFLSFGLILTLWTASSGIVSLMEALTWAYGARDTRSYWKKRSIALCATIVGALLFLAIFGLLTAGHLTAIAIISHLGGSHGPRAPFEFLRWVASVLLVCLAINLINYFLPDVDRPWRWYTPGTLLIALIFLLGSAAFKFYVTHFANFPKVYGALSTFIVIMTWIYISVAILLTGAKAEHILDHINAKGMAA